MNTYLIHNSTFMEEKKENILDFTIIVPMMFKKWKVYALCMVGVVVFSLIFVFTIPRYYACKVMLAPEASANSNGLNSLMSSFGLNEMETTDDAISPRLYPDLMTSNDFIVSMFSVEITTMDGELTTTYYDYLLHHNKNAWYTSFLGKLLKVFETKEPEVSIKEMKGRTFSPAFLLTDDQHDVAGLIADKIQCDYDKKTGVISVTVKDQDPLVCALIADTVSNKLQDFILDYRTKKARNDLDYTQRIYDQTKAEYEESNEHYVNAVDANWDIVNETAKARLETLSNDKKLKFQTFTAITQKLEGAKAKLQEATPVITVLQGSSVPQKPAGPKRVFITFGLMILVCLVYTMSLIVKSKKA